MLSCIFDARRKKAGNDTLEAVQNGISVKQNNSIFGHLISESTLGICCVHRVNIIRYILNGIDVKCK